MNKVLFLLIIDNNSLKKLAEDAEAKLRHK